jgi:hypothetical protein
VGIVNSGTTLLTLSSALLTGPPTHDSPLDEAASQSHLPARGFFFGVRQRSSSAFPPFPHTSLGLDVVP